MAEPSSASPLPPFLKNECATCAKSSGELLLCSRCRSIRYCSIECQRTAWKSHKPLCQQLSSSAASYPMTNYPLSSMLGLPVVYRDLSATEEFIRLFDSNVVMAHFHNTTNKEVLQNRSVALQNLAKAATTASEQSKWLEKTTSCLEGVYRNLLTITPFDNLPSLEYKMAQLVMGGCKRVLKQIGSRAVDSDRETSQIGAIIGQIEGRRMFQGGELVASLIDDGILKESAAVEWWNTGIGVHDAQDGGTELAKVTMPKLRKQFPYKQRTATPPGGGKKKKGGGCKKPPFYPGPPPWRTKEGQDFLSSQFPGVGFGFLMSSVLFQRELDSSHRFYCTHYGSRHYVPDWAPPAVLEGAQSAGHPNLTFAQHMRIHIANDAAVTVKSLPPPPAEQAMSLKEFKELVTIELPDVIVGACDFCRKPALGECLCGECYCSEACHSAHWNDHMEVCQQVLDNTESLATITPLSWGQKPWKIM